MCQLPKQHALATWTIFGSQHQVFQGTDEGNQGLPVETLLLLLRVLNKQALPLTNTRVAPLEEAVGGGAQ